MGYRDNFDARGCFPKDEDEGEFPKHHTASSELVGRESAARLLR